MLKQSVSDIRKSMQNNQTMVKNFGYLSILKVCTIIFPLFTLPYLVTVLGKETYGIIVYAESIISYFIVVVSFGFSYSATKDISIYRNDKEKLSEIVSSVFIVKGLFFFTSIIILSILLYFIPYGIQYRLLFYLTMYVCLNEWLSAFWYFQGLEQMKFITIINLINKSIFLILTFICIKNQSDYYKVPLINGIGALVAGIISFIIIFKHHKIVFKFQKISTLKIHTIQSLPIFFAILAHKIKAVSNKSLIGIFVGMESVAMYEIADKIRQAFYMGLEVISNVIFPSVSKNKNNIFVRKIIRITFIIGVVLYLFMGICLNIFIPKYFPNFNDVISIFWIIGVLIFLQSVSSIINTSILIVNNLYKQYLINLYISLLVYSILIFIIYIYDFMNIYTISVCLVVSFLSSYVHYIYVLKKKKLLNWIL